jgi:hypothetical protein
MNPTRYHCATEFLTEWVKVVTGSAPVISSGNARCDTISLHDQGLFFRAACPKTNGL